MKSSNVLNKTINNLKPENAAKSGQNKKKKIIKKLKTNQLRTLANGYLSNISLDGNITVTLKNDYYSRTVSNDFECFLCINKIHNEKENQSEYFNNYKNKVISRKKDEKISKLKLFLRDEFSCLEGGESFRSDVYIEKLLNNSQLNQNSKQISGEVANNIPAINIIPSATFNNQSELNSLTNKNRINDKIEQDYLQNQVEKISTSFPNNNNKAPTSSILTLSSNSSTTGLVSGSSKLLPHSLNSALVSISHKIAHKISKSPNEALGDLLEINTKHGNTSRRFRRTISESSSESTYNAYSKNPSSLLTGVSNSNTNSNYKTVNSGGGYKPSLFNNLRKLNTEKLMFMSSNAPIGVFSRLPFKLNLK